MRKEEIHLFQQDKVYLSQRQGIRTLVIIIIIPLARNKGSWYCSDPTPFSFSFHFYFLSKAATRTLVLKPQMDLEPQLSKEAVGSFSLAELILITSTQHRTKHNENLISHVTIPLQASSTWQQQIHHMQEALCNTDLTKQL